MKTFFKKSAIAVAVFSVMSGFSHAETTAMISVAADGDKHKGDGKVIISTSERKAFTSLIFPKIYGELVSGDVEGATVTMTSGVVDKNFIYVYGGYSETGNAKGNQLEFTGGTISVLSGEYHGGYTEGSDSVVSDNQVTISGGFTLTGEVYGGGGNYLTSVYESNTVKNNKVTITKGTVNGAIYGGAYGGLTQYNGVEITPEKKGDVQVTGSIYGAFNLSFAQQPSGRLIF